ncbi:hypothetical protein [Actinoplanes sp. NBRC 101535]|uniref:hypothetical protein n=1 Tax=Actinoplanes sp. NBRC 101535 TaxID=3032196 RepID=UPI0024A35828|nr:hypothetical protein [Actinoplanes sp. NBRC 101535]GLY02162.1 hypothetical protein Acsp01_25410 [Actinoplanes sp. NBRC 101535]
MSRPEETAGDLLVTLAACRRELGRYAEAIWQSHDFGEDSTLLTDLEVELPDGSTGVLLRCTAQRWHPGAVSDDVDVELTIRVDDRGFVVESVIRALLVAASGDHPAGAHLLHHDRSGAVDFATALAAARARVAALWTLDDRLPALGFPVR